VYCLMGGNVNTRRISKPEKGSIFHIIKSMKYYGHRKLLFELLILSKFNAFNLLGYWTSTDASVLVYKFRPERTGFNMYAEYTQLQLTFLATEYNLLGITPPASPPPPLPIVTVKCSLMTNETLVKKRKTECWDYS